ncbi:MAG: DUF6185 family protein [Rubricoccaceae bacterium]|nr:DUF6185 family protein [Rubricoccaceae bacterium]
MVQISRNPTQHGPHTEQGSDRHERPDDLSSHSHRQVIGYIGLLLPALLIIMVLLRDGMELWKNLESISAYYYTGAVAAFVGMLIALALFLFTYRGYENKYHWSDRAAGITAAVAALGVALFPTAAPQGVPQLTWWSSETGVLHYGCAIMLFAMFAVYALWLFRLTSDGNRISPGKRLRNRVYVACGLVIVVSMVWALLAGLDDKSIFLPESIALIAFAISWLVKGRALRSIRSTARSLLRLQTEPNSSP